MLHKIFNHTAVKIFLYLFLLVGVLVNIFPSLFPFGDLLQVYAVQTMLLYLFFGLLCMMNRQSGLMMLSFACCALLCVHLKQLDRPLDWRRNVKKKKEQSISIPKLKLAHFNLSAGGSKRDIIEGIKTTEADLVSIHEIRMDLMQELQDSLREEYPFQEGVIDIQTFLGATVFSKHPIACLDTIYFQTMPSIMGCLQKDDIEEDVFFIATNTFPAFSPVFSQKLEEQLQTITEKVDSLENPLLVMGDFNAVPWSRIIKNFEFSTNLKNSRRGFMSSLPGTSFSFLDVPVHHIFHSSQFQCSNFELLTNSSHSYAGIQGIFELIPKKEEDEKTPQ